MEIDVSGCRFIDEYEHCGICKELCEGHCLILQDIECKTYEDCYYRQLKMLEQENAKLKEALEEIKKVFKKYDSEEEGTVAELLHDVFEVYGRVCEVLKDE